MLRLLRPQFDSIILTRYHDNPRSVFPTDLLKLVHLLDAEAATDRSSVSIFNDPISAWEACRAMVDADSLVCITGSFFLAAEIRDALRDAGPGMELNSPPLLFFLRNDWLSPGLFCQCFPQPAWHPQ